MKEIRIALSRFDLPRFIGKILDFMRQNNLSPTVVVCFSEDGDLAELEVDEINRDSILGQLFQGNIFFLPFSDINVGEPVPCADGNQYSLSNSSDLDEEVAVSVDEVESVGFLVQVEQEMAVICPAVFQEGEYFEIESAEMEEDLKEFNEPMNQFVQQFVIN